MYDVPREVMNPALLTSPVVEWYDKMILLSISKQFRMAKVVTEFFEIGVAVSSLMATALRSFEGHSDLSIAPAGLREKTI